MKPRRLHRKITYSVYNLRALGDTCEAPDLYSLQAAKNWIENDTEARRLRYQKYIATADERVRTNKNYNDKTEDELGQLILKEIDFWNDWFYNYYYKVVRTYHEDAEVFTTMKEGDSLPQPTGPMFVKQVR